MSTRSLRISMSILKRITFIIIFSFNCFSQQAWDRKYTAQEIEQIQKGLNLKLEKNLKSYLNEINFSSFVTVNSTILPKEAKKIDPIKEKKPEPIEEELSLFLVNHPKDTYVEKDIERPKIDNTDYYKIKNVSSKIIVYEALDNALNKDIDAITRESLSPYKLTPIKKSYIESTRYYSEQLKATGEDSETFVKGLVSKNATEILRLIGVLFISIVIIIGIIILARLLKGPLNLIANSFKNLSSKNFNSPPPKSEPGETLSKGEAAHLSSQFRKNLNIFKNIITSAPENIIELITKSEKDSAGIKKVIPYIYDEAIVSKLKDVMGSEQIEKLKKSNFEFEKSTDFFDWFNKTVEELSIKSISSTWTVIEKIPNNLRRELLSLDEQVIVNYANEKKTNLSYLYALDILKGDAKDQFVSDLQTNDWKEIITTNTTTAEEIAQECQFILDYANSSVTASALSSEKVKDNIILPSLLTILPLRPLKVQDDFIETIKNISPEVSSDVSKRYWTPRSLLRVPTEYLNETFRDFGIDEKTNIISSMPEDVSTYLLSIIPDGKMKDVLLDNLEKSNKENEGKQNISGRNFINKVFDDFKKQKFTLGAEVLSFSRENSSSDVDELDVDDLDDFDQDFDDDNSVAS